jgi:hypothetical protein
MPRFSERHGYVAAKAIQFEDMDAALRTSLWNFIDKVFFESEEYQFHKDAQLKTQAMIVYDRFHKKAVRTLPFEIDDFVSQEFKWFAKAQWYEVYDHCEFCLSTLGDANTMSERQASFNWVLEEKNPVTGLLTEYLRRLSRKNKYAASKLLLILRTNIARRLSI